MHQSLFGRSVGGAVRCLTGLSEVRVWKLLELAATSLCQRRLFAVQAPGLQWNVTGGRLGEAPASHSGHEEHLAI